MRDFHMAYGNMFFLTYGSYTSRLFQNYWLEDIINQMIKDGNLILSANEPNLDQMIFSNISPDYADRWKTIYGSKLLDKNLFHTAGILKHNNIAFSTLIAGTPIGTSWIKNWLKQQNVKVLVASKSVGHIDGANSILNNDTILTSDINNPIWKKHFKNIIPCPMVSEYWEWINNPSIAEKIRNPTGWLYEFQGHFQQFNAEANALSLNSNTVMLSFYEKTFYDMLKDKYGITAIFAEWKNRHFWGGGLHCITCDIERYSE
jgi:hypothetical protein